MLETYIKVSTRDVMVLHQWESTHLLFLQNVVSPNKGVLIPTTVNTAAVHSSLHSDDGGGKQDRKT